MIPLTLAAFSTLLGAATIAAAASCPKGQSVGDARCCVWYDVLDEIQDELFDHGQCDEVAHDALRLVFHDAIGYSLSRKKDGQFPGGGADGSIMIFKDIELGYPGNEGLDEIVEAERVIAQKYNVTWGDFIQFAGAVSVGNCAGGPKIPFWAGRANGTQPAPDNGLLPDAGDSVDTILARMEDGGFSSDELVALLASHSIAVQEHVDRSIPFTPFDTTPEILDSQFYLEVLLKGTLFPGNGPHTNKEALSPLPGEFRLQSDGAIARDRRTACEWQRLMINEASMQSKFGKAMDKLAVVGYNKKDLYDCSSVIPTPRARKPRLPHLPAGKKFWDIEFSCPPYNLLSSLPSLLSSLPTFDILPGPLTAVPLFSKGHDRLKALAEAARKLLP